MRVCVIGGGAAGYFGAIACAERHHDAEVTILEATHKPLHKVSISGGGRCNVTHHCFDPAELVKAYPRGGKELIGAFNRFQPRDTFEWFARRGVKLKAEADGRMFPVSDQSATITDCFQKSAAAAGVVLRTGVAVVAVRLTTGKSAPTFEIDLRSGEVLQCDKVLLATGSSPRGYEFARALGHTIIPCVPSLFAFNIKDQRLHDLAGLSFENAHLRLSVEDKKHLEQTGAVLITHRGLSGPAVLKLSARGARVLAVNKYHADLIVNWLPDDDSESLRQKLHAYRDKYPKRSIMANNFLPLPKRFWERIVAYCGIDETTTWAHVTKDALSRVVDELTQGCYRIVGKGEFLEEFVTCGGVKLKEVDFRTMESRICPGLYFAGEILDIDAITGGYNLQSAWTTGWIAGQSM